MAIGCRTNVLYNPATEELDMATAVQHPPWAIDFFIMPKSIQLVEEIPDFLIGSIRFDNWIVMKGLKSEDVAVVDVTEPHPVLHPYAAQGEIGRASCREGGCQYV